MEMSPKAIVAELDRYIIGQSEAKKAVAIALRNRYRRSRLPEEIRNEITPKNIIMKGPTGVGKTEIARRLAKLVKAPFIKVEATKFTEVGYVGREVKARERAEKSIADAIIKAKKAKNSDIAEDVLKSSVYEDLRSGKLDNVIVELELDDEPKSMELMPGSGVELNIGQIMGGFLPKKKKHRKVTVKEGLKILTAGESEKMIDMDNITTEGIRRAEQEGIIFIDEIDKIAGKGASSGPDVSREGVQRDILPIVEGSTVMTKYGAVKTDYILFIASGAFHVSSIGDLIPELQGRFPIRVELNSLSYEDFVNILTIPENAITKQYAQLLGVDNINLIFKDDAIKAMSRVAYEENCTMEDIGARRLYTIMEKLLEDVSFNASGDHPVIDVVIDEKYVVEHLGSQAMDHDLKRYIL